MKRWYIIVVLCLVPFMTGGGCPAEVKTTVVDGKPGISLVIGEETAEKIDTGITKLEKFLKVADDVLPILVGAADKIGDATGNEDLGEDANDTAEKAMAALGVLGVILGFARNLTKKEDDE